MLGHRKTDRLNWFLRELGGGDVDTIQSLGLMGANVVSPSDYDVTVYSPNLLVSCARAFCPWTDSGGYGYSNVPLKGNGWPQAGETFAVQFQTHAKTAAFTGVLKLSYTGQTPVANSYPVGVSMDTPVYNAGTNKTTANITIADAPASDGFIVLSFIGTDADFADLELMMPGYNPGDTSILRAPVKASYERFGVLRFMDMLQTNNSTDTGWSGSSAANTDNNRIYYRHSLANCMAIAHDCEATAWLNVPHGATDAYMTSYFAELATLMNGAERVYVEFTNEPWNFVFTQYGDLIYAAAAAGGTVTSEGITSIVRASNVVTVVFDEAHGRTTGNSIYIGSFGGVGSSKLVTVTVTNATTLTYAEVGANVTGTINSGVNSWIHLTPTHALARPLTTYGHGDYPDCYEMGARYYFQRAKQMRTAAVAAGISSRVDICLGIQTSYPDSAFKAATWAVEEYGDLSAWAQHFAGTFYVGVEAADGATVNDVFSLLDADLIATGGYVTQCENLAAGHGLTLVGYEAGQHVIKDASTAAVKASAQVDSRMRTLISDIHASWRQRTQEPACFFNVAVSETFSGTDNNMFPCYLATVDETQAKPLGIADALAADATQVGVSGANTGTLDLDTVLPRSVGGNFTQNGMRVFDATWKMPEIAVRYFVPTAGTKTLTLKAGSEAANDWVTVELDGVVVATQAALPVVTLSTTHPGNAVSQSVGALAAGWHTVVLQMRPTSRAANNGLYQLVIA